MVDHVRQRLDDVLVVLQLVVEHVKQLIPLFLRGNVLFLRELEGRQDRRETVLVLLHFIVDLRFQHVRPRARHRR